MFYKLACYLRLECLPSAQATCLCTDLQQWLSGVLTKLDIMDRGTNALRVLKNEVVPLRLGYIGMSTTVAVPDTMYESSVVLVFALVPCHVTVWLSSTCWHHFHVLCVTSPLLHPKLVVCGP